MNTAESIISFINRYFYRYIGIKLQLLLLLRRANKTRKQISDLQRELSKIEKEIPRLAKQI